ncbi:hypothetical protein Dtox_2661 [Desulfofarcimen acetoxidans DSM 771]|uniref:Uncharacterized protein n=1 Tax=Desulfofarcimen acetoxidans (strain ATCC 49208 / DSM 771 / KCTC 5769 / VKM B-1644 / 5575) TaxID=485916 RepID=C8W147_DESAS|nr:hypothetical protein [Desulfofarcimen acetoxidans]ACV63443.1 hypothetical protein Dtox_2661 [Desulfofarcimen acetoxidans DSM 771]
MIAWFEKGVKKKRSIGCVVWPMKIFLALVIVFIAYRLYVMVVLMGEKDRMEQYLKEKYGKEFVIERMGYYHEYLGAPKEIKGIVHPKDDKEFKFDIRKFADGHVWKSRYVYVPYNERYLWLLWAKQAEKPIKGFINSNMFDVVVILPHEDIESVLKGKTIDLSEAKKLFKNKLSLEIQCALFDSGQKGSGQSRLEQVFAIVKSCKDDDFHEISLRAVFFDKSYEQSVEKDFKNYMNSADPTYRKMKVQGAIKIEYRITNINNVNTPDEINNYIDNN